MTAQFALPFADLLKTASFGQLPNQVQTFVEDGLIKSREATLKSFAAAKEGAEAIEKVTTVAQRGSGELAAKFFDQVIQNTEAAFNAAQSIAQQKSPLEAAQLQAQFVQGQLAKAGEQTKELFALSTKVAQDTAKAVSGFAANSASYYKS